LKPAWEKLEAEFKDSKTALVANVDCTVEEDLCQKIGVEGYPTIKHGDPKALKDYEGGREYDELLKFAQENLGPTCGPKNLDLCDEKQKKEIGEVQAMKDDDLKAKIKEKEAQFLRPRKNSRRRCRHSKLSMTRWSRLRKKRSTHSRIPACPP